MNLCDELTIRMLLEMSYAATAPKLRKRKRKKRKPLPKTQRTRQLQNRSTCRPSTCATPCCPITATKRVL